jgi:hypothetical protein
VLQAYQDRDRERYVYFLYLHLLYACRIFYIFLTPILYFLDPELNRLWSVDARACLGAGFEVQESHFLSLRDKLLDKMMNVRLKITIESVRDAVDTRRQDDLTRSAMRGRSVATAKEQRKARASALKESRDNHLMLARQALDLAELTARREEAAARGEQLPDALFDIPTHR